MKKLSSSLLLLLTLISLGLPRGPRGTAYAGSPAALDTSLPAVGSDKIALSNGIVVTVDPNTYAGANAVRLSSPSGPVVALLQTVPPFPGVTFQLGGKQYVTGADGSAAVIVPSPGTYDLQVITDTFKDPYRRVEFSRWLSESFQPTRQIHLPAKQTVQVGLNVYELVGQKFVDLSGKPVDVKRLKQFSIRSIQGDAFTFHDGTPRWIPASRVTRRRTGGLQEVPLLYTVTEVMVDGSNVVNKAQQQFYAQPNGTWTISLLLYSLRIVAKDALFGFPQGSGVQLYLPDGRVQTYPLDKSGSAQMHSLARGNYSFQVTGVPGITARAPIALSKDQELDTRVISYLDLGIIAGAGALLALGLLLFGRMSLRRSRSRSEESQGVRILDA